MSESRRPEPRPSSAPPSASELAGALNVLRRGGVVGYPSETVWGLAALPQVRAGVERLYQLKGRDDSKPVQLSCLTEQDALGWVRADAPGQEPAEQMQAGLRRLAQFWPGPLTVLAWARVDAPPRLAPGGAVGLRVPDHPAAQALLTVAGGTLATTSLNPSGLPPATTRQQAQRYGLADVLLASGSASSGGGSLGQASTVFDLRTRQVLRAGPLGAEELLAALL